MCIEEVTVRCIIICFNAARPQSRLCWTDRNQNGHIRRNENEHACTAHGIRNLNVLTGRASTPECDRNEYNADLIDAYLKDAPFIETQVNIRTDIGEPRTRKLPSGKTFNLPGGRQHGFRQHPLSASGGH